MENLIEKYSTQTQIRLVDLIGIIGFRNIIWYSNALYVHRSKLSHLEI